MRRLLSVAFLLLTGCASTATFQPEDRCRGIIFDEGIWGKNTVAMIVVASTVGSTYGSVLETIEGHNGFKIYLSKAEERVFENAQGIEVYSCD